MRIWTVHTPPDSTPGRRTRRRGLEAALRLPVLVPEGFAWAALVFGPLWLLRHALWLEALAWLALLAILVAVLPVAALVPAGIALQVLLGAHAQDLRRFALARRHYAEANVVAERDADRALARVLEARPDAGPARIRLA